MRVREITMLLRLPAVDDRRGEARRAIRGYDVDDDLGQSGQEYDLGVSHEATLLVFRT